jgi:sugar phosphate isomerase/epimerase
LKIGVNTYSFRNELEKKSLNIEQVFKIVKKIGMVDGIELLDRHIPGWGSADLNKGIKDTIELAKSYNLKLFALGPHLKMFREVESERETEIKEYFKWIDYAHNNGINQIRSQVTGGGKLEIFARLQLSKGLKITSILLDKVLPYAEKQGVKIGIETHWGFSSSPPFLDKITEKYKESPSLGVTFDWGNFFKCKNRYEALEIAARPHNHCHNHVKFFSFGENFQQLDKKGEERHYYDSQKIVNTFRQNNFNNYFSIEFEGSQPTLEGVYKSVHGLKYAITNGAHKIDPNFDWNSLDKNL